MTSLSSYRTVEDSIHDFAVLGQAHGGVAQPVVALLVFGRVHIDDELSAVGGFKRPVDQAFHAVEIVCRQARHQVNGELGMRKFRVHFPEEGIGDGARRG